MIERTLIEEREKKNGKRNVTAWAVNYVWWYRVKKHKLNCLLFQKYVLAFQTFFLKKLVFWFFLFTDFFLFLWFFPVPINFFQFDRKFDCLSVVGRDHGPTPNRTSWTDQSSLGSNRHWAEVLTTVSTEKQLLCKFLQILEQLLAAFQAKFDPDAFYDSCSPSTWLSSEPSFL